MDDGEQEWLPYELQPDEPQMPFSHFVAYRDAGPTRTLRALAAQQGVRYEYVRQLSWTYNWRARTRAWDAEMDRAKRAAMLQRQDDVINAHRALAEAMRHKAAAAVANTVALDAEDVVRWVNTAIKIEQAAYRLPVAAPEPTDKTPADVYFDSLSGLKMLRLGKQAITALQQEVENDPPAQRQRFGGPSAEPAHPDAAAAGNIP